MHQSPRLVDDFALNYFTHKLPKLLSEWKELIVKVFQARTFIADWHAVGDWGLLECTRNLIVLSAIIVPPVLFLLQDNKVDRLDCSFCLINPLKDELHGAVFWVQIVSLEG